MSAESNKIAATGIDKAQVHAGVKALLSYLSKKADHAALLGDVELIQMQICMKNVPKVKNKIIKIRLPHSLLLPTSDICLFVRDINAKSRDYSPTERHFQELLDKKGIKGITKILPLKALKLEYQPFEAKRNLSDMYDMYLGDASIVRLLPGFLGKAFYGKKRHPVQVNLNVEQLKAEFQRAMHTAQCIIGGRGSSCQVTVGHSGLTEDQLTENLVMAVEKVCSGMPGGAPNIRNMHIKTTASPAIPIYISLESADDVVLEKPKRKRQLVGEPEDVATVMGAKVRVTEEGYIRLIPEGEPEHGGSFKRGKPRPEPKTRKQKPNKMLRKKLGKASGRKTMQQTKSENRNEANDKSTKKLIIKKKQTLKAKKEKLLSKAGKLSTEQTIKAKEVKVLSKGNKLSTKLRKNKVPLKQPATKKTMKALKKSAVIQPLQF